MPIKYSIGRTVAAALFCLSFFTGCEYPHPEDMDYLLSDMQLDSTLVHPLKSGFTERFVFSPIRKNAIWTIENGEKIELDLETGQIKPLEAILSKSLRSPFKMLSVDPFREQSFFYEADEQLIYYSSGQKTTVVSEENAITSDVLYEADRIWIGGTFGLLCLERSSGQIKKIKGLPAIWMTKVNKTDNSQEILLNNMILFHPSTNQWEYQISEENCKNLGYFEMSGMHFYRNEQRVFRYTDPRREVHTVHESGLYQGNPLCARHATLWTQVNFPDSVSLNWYDFADKKQGALTISMFAGFWNTGLFCTNGHLLLGKTPEGWVICDRINKTLYYFPQKLPANVRQIEMDSRNVYILFSDQFMVVSIDWMRANAIPLENYHAEVAEFKRKSDELLNEPDVRKRIALYNDIRRRFGKTQNPFIRIAIGQLINEVYRIDYSDAASVKLIEEQIAAGHLDSIQKAIFYAGITTHFARVPNIEKAMTYGKLYLDLSVNKNWAIFSKIKTFQQERDSLQRLRLPDDAYAYAYGIVLENYCNGNDIFEASSMYTVDLATQQYKEVLRKYPDSPWADNAAFDTLIIDLFHYCEGGCSYGPEDLKRLDQFVKKYPDSEKIPQAWLYAAIICQELYDEDPQIARNAKRLGFSYLTKIKDLYPAYSSQKYYQEILQSYMRQPDLFWSVRAVSDRKTFQQGNPIHVHPVLRNLNDSVQTFTSAVEYLFSVKVMYASGDGCAKVDAPFKPTRKIGRTEKLKTTMFSVNAQDSKKWTFDLLSTAFSSHTDYGNLGLFDFSMKGNYFIQMKINIPNLEQILTEELSLTVE